MDNQHNTQQYKGGRQIATPLSKNGLTQLKDLLIELEDAAFCSNGDDTIQNAMAFKRAKDAECKIIEFFNNHTQKKVIEARIETGKYFRGYMISSSSFISKILNPYLTEQRRLLKQPAINELEN